MVSGGEALLPVTLLPGLDVVGWPGVGCWPDSRPNAVRAFSDT